MTKNQVLNLKLLALGWGISAIIVTCLTNGCAADGPSGSEKTVEPEPGPTLPEAPEVLPAPEQAPGNGMPEVCDGVDNDENGIVDDLDVGGDGVCDCENICTLGEIGPWGSGNVFKAWLDARSPRPSVPLATLQDSRLFACDVLVILDVAEFEVKAWNGNTLPAHASFSLTDVEIYKEFLRQGKGVFSTAGYLNSNELEVRNVNRLLAESGLSYLSTNRYLTGDITLFEESPLTSEVQGLYEQNGIEVSGGEILAHFDDGSAALAVSDKVVAWNGEWISYDETFAGRPDLQVERFWINVLAYLAPARTCTVPLPVPE